MNMDALKKAWDLLRPDLKKHLGVGAAIGFLTTVALTLLLMTHTPATLTPALAVSLMAGVVLGERIGWLKEYFWDAAGHGQVDRDDYLYTGRGAITGAVLGAVSVLVVWRLVI